MYKNLWSGIRQKGMILMKIKKLVTILSITIIAVAMLTVTAQATTVNKYNKVYGDYSTVADLYWQVDGSLTKAKTYSENEVKSSRYIEANVDVYVYGSDKYITGNDNYATGENVGVSASIARNAKSTNRYYVHTSVMKPSASNTFIIGSNYYRVNQRT